MTDTPLVVLSLGAGVQSTTLLVASARGELGVPRYDAAIFADTGNEPQAVYDHLTDLTLAYHATIPIHVVEHGSIIDDLWASAYAMGNPPFFVRHEDGGVQMLNRQCTRDYKIRPIRRKARELMEARGLERIEQHMGISIDEASRMRDSGRQYITNRYPLVELGLDRRACEAYLRKLGIIAPKSACIICPYHSDSYWRSLKREDPEAWAIAVDFDASLRDGRVHGLGVRGERYLHRSGRALPVVDLRTAEERGQVNMFENECEGVCGV